MEKENKKLKITVNKKIVTFSLLALALLILGSTSYAYFTATIEGNDTAKETTVKTGTMSLSLNGTTEAALENAMPGQSKTINFNVTNTGTIATTYALKTDITNNFKDKKDLVYVLKKGDTIVKKETPLPSPISGTTVLLPVVEIASGATDNYTMTITFKETGDDQNDNQGKTFTGRIQIGEATDKMLAVNLIKNSNVKTTTPDFANYPNEENTGLFQAEDDEGTSYYYRGNIENNYVDIGTTYSEDVSTYAIGINSGGTKIISQTTQASAESTCTNSYSTYGYSDAQSCIADIQDYSAHAGDKMLWRVVRINGDGSIRLISDNIINKKAFNSTYNERKYVGYTYLDDSGNEIDSTIKTYLDSWYTTNITNKGLDSIIQTSAYCNDTSISSSASGSYIYYGANGRIYGDKLKPQLTCNETEQTYGGKYSLKVGLLSADELMLAGYNNLNTPYAHQKTYVWNPNWFWTGSPYFSRTSSASVYTGSYIGAINSSGTNIIGGVRPVINLRSDILFSSGDGTKDNPYVVKAN